MYVTKTDSGITVRQFQDKLAAAGRQTFRRLVAAHPEPPAFSPANRKAFADALDRLLAAAGPFHRAEPASGA